MRYGDNRVAAFPVGSGALLAIVVALLVAAPCVLGARWSWELDNTRYRRLNAFQRAQYDRAAKMLKESNFGGAAAEFEKFKIQFPDSDLLPYVVFMIGYSQHQNKQRNAAIRTYNEVLDYFGDVVADAAPAIYFMGIAELENGEIRSGMLLLKEMIDDEDYQLHPLAAGALRRVADNAWRNKEYPEAIRYYKQVVRDFGETNTSEAGIARSQITSYYIKSRDYASYQQWLVNDENREDAKHRRWMAEEAWQQAYRNFHGDWDGEYTNFNRDKKNGDMAAFYEWFKAQKAWYEGPEDTWRYWHNVLLFASHRLRDRDETKQVLATSVIPMSREIPDEKARNDRFAWLSDRLREVQDFDQALYTVSFMNEAPHALYKEYEIMRDQGHWTAAVERLEAIENLTDAEWATRALAQRAWVYRDRLNDYEKAIQLYQQLSNPPDNLWAIQEAYKRWGKLREALGVLAEIEGSFPDHSSRAAWHRASYYNDAGEKEQAIAHARRILRVYPKSREASQAHQLLEQYGIDTGGAVAD